MGLNNPITPASIGAVPITRNIATSADLTGGNTLAGDLALGLADPAADPSGTVIINNLTFTINRKGLFTNRVARNAKLLDYDFAIDGNVQSLIVDITGYNSFSCLIWQAVNNAGVLRAIQLSVDGGATFFSALGDYNQFQGNTPGTLAAFVAGSTAGTGARPAYYHMTDTNQNGIKMINIASLAQVQVFTASVLPITHVRITGISAAGVGAPTGLFTAGKVLFYAYP